MIRCPDCEAPLDFTRDLLARRFRLDASQRMLTPGDVLLATAGEQGVLAAGNGGLIAVLDHSRASFQHLLGCPSCLALVRADRPSRADDVVPGKVSLALPGSVVVRAARRMERAAASGRAAIEMRVLAAHPVARYALRVPIVFRALRGAFAENAVLVASATASVFRAELTGPQGLIWDDGPPVGEGRVRLRRMVARATPLLQRIGRALPLAYGEVAVLEPPRGAHPAIVRFARGTRLPVLGEDGAALRLGPPRVTFEEPGERLFLRGNPPQGFVATLDLLRPE